MKATTTAPERMLLTEHTEKIEAFKSFLKDVLRSVNDALLAYEGLGISYKLTLNELSNIEREGIERTIKKKLVQAMPETQLAGMPLDKEKYIEIIKMPDLSTFKHACNELFELVNNFELGDGSRMRHWTNYISETKGKIEIDMKTVDEHVDQAFRVYLEGKQIPLYKALKEISDQLNKGVLPNTDKKSESRSFLRMPHSDPLEYIVNWEKMFKEMLSWNDGKNQFEVKTDFVLKH